MNPIDKILKVLFIRTTCILSSLLLLFGYVSPVTTAHAKTAVEETNSRYEEAKVTDVIDGDSIKVRMNHQDYKVRFILVDTPETVHPYKEVEFYGKEASQFTTDNLLHKTVYLEQDVSDTDKYHRLLRYIWLKKPKEASPTDEELSKYCFNSILLENGYANLSTFPPDIKYLDFFQTRAEIARTKKSGLYSTAKKHTNVGKRKNKKNKNRKYKKKRQKKNKKRNNKKASKNLIQGNINSKIYHVPGQRWYNRMNEGNVVYFETEKEAIAAGYRKSKR